MTPVRPRWVFAFAILVGATVGGASCQEEKPPPPAKKRSQAAASRIERVSTAVPPGVQIPCGRLFDVKRLSADAGFEVSQVRDISEKNKTLTAKCEFLRAGKAPGTRQQAGMSARGGDKLGVLPGDAYCSVEVNCSLYEDSARFKKACRAAGDELTEELGADTCVHKTQASAEWSYRMTAVHRETKCRLIFRGGPSVTNRDVVARCGMALLRQVTTEKIDAAVAP